MTQKINYIAIENFKWIKHLEVNELGRFVAIYGHNGAWKTSFINWITACIKAEKWVNKKVRIWEEQWQIEIRFDDFIIKRIIGEKWWLKVEHNWKLVPSPQNRLDEIFQWSIGDPNKFLSLRSRDKVRYILETQWKKEEYNQLEEKREELFNQRQDIHRTYLAKKEEVDKTDTTKFSDITKWFDEIELKRLEWEFMKIEENNKKFNELETRLARWKDVIINTNNKISESEERIKDLEARLEAEKNKKKENIELLEKSKELISEIESEIEAFVKQDASEIIEQMSIINEKRKWFAQSEAQKGLYEEQCKKRDELYWVRADLDKKVRIIEWEQNKLLEWLDIAVKLKLEDGIMSALIWENRIPLDELNKAMQIEIWVDICLNGPNKIKIITIEDANTLDPNTLERIKTKIEKMWWQCFIETVYSTWYDEIIIQDWEVVKK